MDRNTLFGGDRVLGVDGVKDTLAVIVGVLLGASLEPDNEEREHAVTPVDRAKDDLGGRVLLLAAIIRPAEHHSDAVILAGVESLDEERPELGGVVDPGNQRHMKGKVCVQPRALNNFDAVQLFDDMLVLFGREGAASIRRLVSPHQLHLDYQADEAVEIGAAGGIAALRYLVPVGHFIDHEEGPGLLQALDGVHLVALWRDNVRVGIWIAVDLRLELHHDLLWGHGQQLGPRPLVVGGEGLVMNMVYQRKEMGAVGVGLRLGLVLTRGAALDTTGAAASHVCCCDGVFCDSRTLRDNTTTVSKT